MTFQDSTRAYREWLLSHGIPLRKEDLRAKKETMRIDPFCFLRGSYYRWAQIWPREAKTLTSCHRLAPKAPRVVAVADLHVENFGTWRNEEEQLVWGINDFDEAYPLPYVHDLVRLSTSAVLALWGQNADWDISPVEACDAITAGYEAGLRHEGGPFILNNRSHQWLADIAAHSLRKPKPFWKRLASRLDPRVKSFKSSLISEAQTTLEGVLSHPRLEREGHRQAGVGSLGKLRWVQLRGHKEEFAAREAKMRAPSACYFAFEDAVKPDKYYETTVERSVRSLDPHLHLSERWVVRRLEPDCTKVEMHLLKSIRHERDFLHAMGYETANIHLATAKPKTILHHLTHQPERWLADAASHMANVVRREFRELSLEKE